MQPCHIQDYTRRAEMTRKCRQIIRNLIQIALMKAKGCRSPALRAAPADAPWDLAPEASAMNLLYDRLVKEERGGATVVWRNRTAA